MVASPLSELYSRLPVVHISNFLFSIFTIACAVSSAIPMFIVFRLGQALCVCGASTLGPGFIADLMPVERRGQACYDYFCCWTDPGTAKQPDYRCRIGRECRLGMDFLVYC